MVVVGAEGEQPGHQAPKERKGREVFPGQHGMKEQRSFFSGKHENRIMQAAGQAKTMTFLIKQRPLQLWHRKKAFPENGMKWTRPQYLIIAVLRYHCAWNPMPGIKENRQAGKLSGLFYAQAVK